MTAPQEEAIKRIVDIMREHFSSGVVVVEGDVVGDDKASTTECCYHGGFPNAIGLCEVGKMRIWLKRQKDTAGD